MWRKKKEMIPQIQPYFDRSEWREVKKVLKSTYLTENEATKKFEQLIADYTGAKYVIAVSNATVGLYCALKSLGVGDDPNDEVIVPDMTFVATANAVLMAGAKVVLCDVGLASAQAGIPNIEPLITKNTKAIIPVYLYGYGPDVFNIKKLCERRGIYCVEDAAQGLGVSMLTNSYARVSAGTIGDLGVISLYGNKNITTGEGGLVLTNNKLFADRVYRLKNHGRMVKGVFIHDSIGYNFSFTDLQAAVGIAQINKYQKIISRKAEIYTRYLGEFRHQNRIDIIHRSMTVSPNYWFSSFLFDDKERLKLFLADKGIQTRNFFYPLHKQPCYQDFGRVIRMDDKKYSGSNELYERGLSLPSSYGLKNKQVDYVIKSVLEFHNGC